MTQWARVQAPTSIALLVSVLAFRSWLESRMSLHMAVELPLLLLGGWLLAGATARHWPLAHSLDNGGLLSATTASCVLALWMVPTALDLAVLEPGVAWLKYGMWIGAGALLHAARGRVGPVLQAFFIGNAAWMTCTAGLLYLDAEQQLCVNYLIDDQQATGWSLLSWSVVLGGWALFALRPLLHGERRGDASRPVARFRPDLSPRLVQIAAQDDHRPTLPSLAQERSHAKKDC